MITGFNTDIDHGGVTYHVQTEDKGLETPMILSLVYVGGAILASKRTPYDDLVSEGFEEKTLTERLQRQHKLICAAIRAGRIEDLKRMAERDTDVQGSPAARKAGRKSEAEPEETIIEEGSRAAEQPQSTSILDLITSPTVPIVPEGLDLRVAAAVNPPFEEAAAVSPAAGSPENGFAAASADDEDELYLKLIDDEGDFRAGQLATIKIYVGRGTFGKSSVALANVTVKVLGTTFRPMILSTQTDEDGTAVVRALLPHFTTGRAAVLIRATDVNGDAAEIRRIIHQA